MSQIAEAVGVIKAALYYFVPGGRQDLLYAIMSFGLDQHERHVSQPARALPDGETRLRAIIRNHMRLITNGSSSRSSGVIRQKVGQLESHRCQEEGKE